MFTKFFAKRRQKRLFSKLVNADVAKSIVEGKPLPIPKIEFGRIEFVFVWVRADGPEQLQERVELVLDFGYEHKIVVHSVVGPMVVMAFGTLRQVHHTATSRTDFVICLKERLDSNIKIVHGSADGYYGNFGSNRSVHYTFTFPHFDAALAALVRLEFGQTEELPA